MGKSVYLGSPSTESEKGLVLYPALQQGLTLACDSWGLSQLCSLSPSGPSLLIVGLLLTLSVSNDLPWCLASFVVSDGVIRSTVSSPGNTADRWH